MKAPTINTPAEYEEAVAKLDALHTTEREAKKRAAILDRALIHLDPSLWDSAIEAAERDEAEAKEAAAQARAIVDLLHAYNREHYAIRLIDAYTPGNGRPATRGTRIS